MKKKEERNQQQQRANEQSRAPVRTSVATEPEAVFIFIGCDVLTALPHNKERARMDLFLEKTYLDWSKKTNEK